MHHWKAVGFYLLQALQTFISPSNLGLCTKEIHAGVRPFGTAGVDHLIWHYVVTRQWICIESSVNLGA